jgi:O-antigen ligase
VFVHRFSLALGAIALLSVLQMVTGQVWVDQFSLPGLSPAEGLNLIDRGMITRPSGTATHPIEFAAVLAMGMPLVFVSASHAVRFVVLHRAAALLVPVVVLMTGSRTAMVCGAVSFLVMMVAWPPRVRFAASGAAVVLLAVMFVAVPGFIGTLRGLFVGASGDPSVKSRTNSYAVVQSFWENHLWLGRGLGTFLPKYWILDNMYLQLVIGVGIIGLVGLLGLVLVCVTAGSRAASRLHDPLDRQLAIAAVAGTLAGAGSLALFDTFAFPQAAGTFFLVMGVCGGVHHCAMAETSGPDEVTP